MNYIVIGIWLGAIVLSVIDFWATKKALSSKAKEQRDNLYELFDNIYGTENRIKLIEAHRSNNTKYYQDYKESLENQYTRLSNSLIKYKQDMSDFVIDDKEYKQLKRYYKTFNNNEFFNKAIACYDELKSTLDKK